MIILIDQDGPLADFEKGFANHWQNQFPDEIFIPPEKRTTFYIEDDYPDHFLDKVRGIYSARGFILSLPPVSGGIEAAHALLEMGHDVRICTSPLSKNKYCAMEKYQWVEKHMGREFTNRVILTKDKTLVRGDFLIDDKPHISGIATPEWERVIFDCHYNRGIPGKRIVDWKNWKEVLNI